MDERNLDKALEIISKLIVGEELNKRQKENVSLYEEYISNAEVSDMVQRILKKLNLCLYEYQDALYVTAEEKNRVFGFSNEELKREIGIKLNKELYLCYFIIYNIITKFYFDSADSTFVEYVRLEEVISAVDESLRSVTSKLTLMTIGELEENSFKQLAVLWEDLPIIAGEDSMLRAARNSKAGYVKLVFNFLVSQDLFLEEQERYYPKNRMRALIENYFEEYQGRLYQIMSQEGGSENAAY